MQVHLLFSNLGELIKFLSKKKKTKRESDSSSDTESDCEEGIDQSYGLRAI